jgi:cell wall-associated NlpC family hydrolase
VAANFRAVAAQDAARFIGPQYVQDFLRQINQESGFNPNARSGAGAQGIAQFMPATAREYGVNPNDPISSLAGAAKYDAQLLHQYGTIQRALSAYNSGKPDAYKDPNFAGGQTYNYVRSILGGTPAAAGGAPASPSPAAVAPTPTPAAAGIPLAVQQILNQNNEQAGIAPVNYGGPAATHVATIGPQKIPVVNVTGQPVTKTARNVVALAHEYLGTKYVYGGAQPGGFDCSGLVQWLYGQKGITVPRTTYDQYKTGHPVARGQLKPGDVVFFEPTAQGPGHEALYIGSGKVIAAPHSGTVVQIQKLSDVARMDGYVGARRLG